MKKFKKTSAHIFLFCLTVVIVGCICGPIRAEAKVKSIRKGFTYDSWDKTVYMDISKLTPKEGETALNQLALGEYGDKTLLVKVKAKSSVQAKKEYISWGKKFQKLATNKYHLLPYSSDVTVHEMWDKKGYYECGDMLVSELYIYYYMNQYIDNIFSFSDPQKGLNGTVMHLSPKRYFKNFVFKYTDPLGEEHTEKISLDYMNFNIKSVYSEILSKEQFATASDAVKVAFLFFPCQHFYTYKQWLPRSNWDMKALAEKRWTGMCGNAAGLGYWLTTRVSFDVEYLMVDLTSWSHAVGFARAKNTDGEWEYFRMDTMKTSFDHKNGGWYYDLETLSEKSPFLKQALTYMKSSPVPELAAMTLEYNIKKGLREGCLDSTIKQQLSRVESDWIRGYKYESISYAFVNQNDETYGCPAITGTLILGEP